MLILTSGVRVKVAVSLLVLAMLITTMNSALVLLEAALELEEVVVLVLLIKDLITANGFILPRAMTVTMMMVTLMLDFPISKLSEETPVASASLVPLTTRMLVLKPLSASSIPAVEAAVVLNLPSMLVASLLNVPRRVMSVFLDMVVLLAAPTLLNTAAPLVKSPALVDAWEEVLAKTVSVFAIEDTRVKIVPLLLN
jgi:hypothetical protein